MVASSSTFRTHLGRVIRDLSRLLYVAPHGTESLVYNAYPREVAAYTWLAIILWSTVGSLFPPLNSGANAARASVQTLMLAMLEPKLQAIVLSIRSLPWEMNGVTLNYCDSEDYPTGG